MSRLVSSQIDKNEHKKYICDGCLVSFSSREKLSDHNQHDCTHVRVDMPDSSAIKKDRFGNEYPANILKFKNCHKQMTVPFVIYADFDAFLEPVSENSITPNKTTNIQRHDVYSFAYFIKCSYNDSLSKFRTYRGDSYGKIFFEMLSADVKEITEQLNTNVPLNDLTPAEEDDFWHQVICQIICKKPLNDDRVRDPDHLTGKYRGAAHNTCNLNYSIPNHIPIFFSQPI